MEDKSTATPSHESASDNGKESPVSGEKASSESQEVQAAADETGASGGGGEKISTKKRGRGRPRKVDAVSNNIGSSEALPPPLASPPSSSMPSSSTKRNRGRPKGSGKLQALASHGEYMDTAGGSFFPHVLTVLAGEDLVSKLASVCAKGPRSFCVLTASGAVSSVTLHKPNSSVGTATYEGWFEILTMTGSSVVYGEMGSTRRINGLLSVSLANAEGLVFGGTVAGPLIAAGPGPIQLVAASFKQTISRGIKRKYSAGRSASANDSASSKRVNLPIQLGENCAPTPVPAKSDKAVAENQNLNSASLDPVGPNNSQKEDPMVAVIHGLNSTSRQSFGPNKLQQTSQASQPMSDEMNIKQ